MFVLAIDFDGTVVYDNYPKIGKLRPHAKEVINYFYDNDVQIIIWTCRYLEQDLSSMIKFLKSNHIKYHEINKNSKILQEFDPKPKIYYDLLIDDRAIGCPVDDWLQIYKIVLNKINEKQLKENRK